MKRTLVRYRTKPDQADTNQRLIEAVFRELKAKRPSGVRYMVLRLPDGTFMHFVTSEDGAMSLPSLAAFQAFQAGIKDRCLEPPQPTEPTLVGSYGFAPD